MAETSTALAKPNGSSKLCALPSELIDNVVSFGYFSSFLRLWCSGDTVLQQKLRRCTHLSVRLEGENSVPVWPSSAFVMAPNLLSFSMRCHFGTNPPSIRGYDVMTLPKSLTSLRLVGASPIDMVKDVHVSCPSLASLSLCCSTNLSNYAPLYDLPHTLTSLSLSLSFGATSDHPLLHRLLLPQLVSFECHFTCLATSQLQSWPPNLECIDCRLCIESPECFASLVRATSLHTFHAQVEFTQQPPVGEEGTERTFPWHYLPRASLTDLSYFGSDHPPPPSWFSLAHALKFFDFRQYGAFGREHTVGKAEVLSEYYKRLPQTIQTFHLSTREYDSQVPLSLLSTLPPSFSSLQIDAQESTENQKECNDSADSNATPTVFTTSLSSFHTLVLLNLLDASSSLCGEKLALPNCLKYLTLSFRNGDRTAPPPRLLNWCLPDSLTSLEAERHCFSPELGAMALPRGLQTLKCLSIAFPADSALRHFPSTLTSLYLFVGLKLQDLPLPCKNANIDICDATKMAPHGDNAAAALPTSLKELWVNCATPLETLFTTVEYDIAPWIATLNASLPLTHLNLNPRGVTLRRGGSTFLHTLPPTLRSLTTPVTNYGGKDFASLPRSLEKLLLHHLDWSWMDIRREHIALLPRRLLAISICSKEITKKDLKDALKDVRMVRVLSSPPQQ